MQTKLPNSENSQHNTPESRQRFLRFAQKTMSPLVDLCVDTDTEYYTHFVVDTPPVSPVSHDTLLLAPLEHSYFCVDCLCTITDCDRGAVGTCNYFPPLPPLVGIETNPGPHHQKTMKGALMGDGTSLASISKQITELKQAEKGSKGHAKTKRRGIGLQMQNGGVKSFSQSNAAVSIGTIAKNSLRFGSARHASGATGMGIGFHQKIANVYAVTGTPTFANNSITQYRFVRPRSFSTPINYLGSVFVRFRMVRMRFFFRPVLSTSYLGDVVFGWTSDAAAVKTLQTEDSIMSLNNSTQANCWMGNDLKIQAKFATDLKYVSDKGDVAMMSLTDPEIRENSEGALLISGAIAGTSDGMTIGHMWLDADLELFEMGDSTAMFSTIRTLLHHAEACQCCQSESHSNQLGLTADPSKGNGDPDDHDPGPKGRERVRRNSTHSVTSVTSSTATPVGGSWKRV